MGDFIVYNLKKKVRANRLFLSLLVQGIEQLWEIHKIRRSSFSYNCILLRRLLDIKNVQGNNKVFNIYMVLWILYKTLEK